MSNLLPFICQPDYPFAQQWISALQAAMPGERVVPLESLDAEARRACDVAIVANPVPADLLTLPNLKWVHSVWAGVERLLADLEHSELKIVRLVDPTLAQTMAEAVLAWTLYLHRDMPRYARQQAAHHWLAHDYVRPQDKTVSLLGMGALGAAAAQKLCAAGFQVLGWSRTRKAVPQVECFAGESELAAMLERTDILVCLLPLTPQTTGIVNGRALGQLRTGASVINFARGAIINDDHLRASLDTGHLSHAVLDVFHQEPLADDAWQWGHPHVTVLPHISAPTDRHAASAIVGVNIHRYRTTSVIPAIVDREIGY